MKFLDTHFSKLDRKWISIKNKKNIEEIEIAQEKKIKGEFYLGYGYIDHFSGRSIALIGDVKKIGKYYEPTYKPSEIEKNIFKLDDVYIKQSELEVEIIEKKYIVKTLRKMIETYIKESFYDTLHKSIDSYRKDYTIDIFRANHNPDNINVLLKDEDVWCRIVEKKKDTLYGILINTPIKEKDISRDDLLILKLDKNKNKYVCIENIKPQEKLSCKITYKIKNKLKEYVYEE